MSELRFENVTVHFGTGRRRMTAVDGVDLTVPSGQVVGLVGESGSGKSTLARAAVGLTPLSSGRMLLNGQMVGRRGARSTTRSALQMAFQDPYSSLDPRMTIGTSIAEAIPPGTIVGRAARRAEVARLLELVSLDPERADDLPSALSGGQRQRVALARALASRPDIIIADEITSALDVSVQGAVLNLVRDLQRKLRLSMLFISHDLAVVRYVSDVIAVMYLGRIVEHGPAEHILTDPQHPYTRELLAAVRHADVGSPDDSANPALIEIRDAEPADPHHPPTGCRFHPRCPVGPLVLAARDECVTSEPPADSHQHHAACHFAAELKDPVPAT